MNHPMLAPLFVHLPKRLAYIRKERGLTQQQTADQAGVHVSQYTRYEAGRSQPMIEVFQRIVFALNVSADPLLFDDSELDTKEREATQNLIDGVLLMHDAKLHTHRVSG